MTPKLISNTDQLAQAIGALVGAKRELTVSPSITGH